jgi:outer membrane protein assembly factor BamD (BamD/ComL family)
VKSTFRFVETFPDHEHAAVVMGAAVDDLYDMREFEQAIVRGRELIDRYPRADESIRRSAWAVVAHACFDTAGYEEAEQAYTRVLDMTPADGESQQAVVDNLAAAIYKQGEQASLAEDHRSAADHFLRIKQAAPSSEIRAAAEYDAGAALIRLEEWAEAAAVLDAFRQAHPDHELHQEATQQIALVYREEGDLSRAAGEYERVATEAEDPELRREALLLAGELFADSEAMDRALAVYLEYVAQFPKPLEIAVETRFKIAGMYQARHEGASYQQQLRQIVEIDRRAGEERTARIRYLAAQSALVLTEDLYRHFEAVELVQPFEQNLQEKQRRMDTALEAFGRLIDYEVGDVTAAATFYMAEVYSDFSRSLTESERPTDLGDAELQSYEMALEEEAFPFEERAIEVHQKNLELLSAGIYNAWIERSLDKLADLMPGRFAKSEASSGLIDSIDSYAYRAPNAPDTDASAEIVETAPDVPDAALNQAETVESTPQAPANAADEALVPEVSDANPR